MIIEAVSCAQVFSKLEQKDDSLAWEAAAREGPRTPFLEPFWLQLIGLANDPELGAAARVPLASHRGLKSSVWPVGGKYAGLFDVALDLRCYR